MIKISSFSIELPDVGPPVYLYLVKATNQVRSFTCELKKKKVWKEDESDLKSHFGDNGRKNEVSTQQEYLQN